MFSAPRITGKAAGEEEAPAAPHKEKGKEPCAFAQYHYTTRKCAFVPEFFPRLFRLELRIVLHPVCYKLHDILRATAAANLPFLYSPNWDIQRRRKFRLRKTRAISYIFNFHVLLATFSQ